MFPSEIMKLFSSICEIYVAASDKRILLYILSSRYFTELVHLLFISAVYREYTIFIRKMFILNNFILFFQLQLESAGLGYSLSEQESSRFNPRGWYRIEHTV